MIIAVIINVKITLLHFLTSLIIISGYKVKIQVKDHIAMTSFVLFERDAKKNNLEKFSIIPLLNHFQFYA